MTATTITKEQGDKLLADFMGIESVNVGQFDKYRLTNSVYSKIFTRSHCQYLDFDKSYDWLMPVWLEVSQISKDKVFIDEMNIGRGSCTIKAYNAVNYKERFFGCEFLDSHNEDLNKTIYTVLVEFVGWYNKIISEKN